MSKYLQLGTNPGEDAWALPEDTNVEQVRKEITAAMTDGTTAVVAVLTGQRKQPGELIINGKALAAALVWETKSSEPIMSIID